MDAGTALDILESIVTPRGAFLQPSLAQVSNEPIFSGEVEGVLEQRLPGILSHSLGGTREAVLFMLLELIGAQLEGQAGGPDLGDGQARALAEFLAAPLDVLGIDQLKRG